MLSTAPVTARKPLLESRGRNAQCYRNGGENGIAIAEHL
jgi:hypothetical protein